MPVDPPSFGGLLLQLVLSLAVVVGLAYLVIRFGLARWLGTQATEARHMEVLETLSLGPRRTVYLVRAMDRLLVIGAAEKQLTTLCDFGVGSTDSYDAASFAAALAQAAGEAPEDEAPPPEGD